MSYKCLGAFDESRAGHNEHYYSTRETVIDFRGVLSISPLSYIGFGNSFITWSHDISSGEYSGHTVDRPVIIDDYAFVTSFCTLYNCHIEHHGIVAIGSVVSGMTVNPYTIVAGNPARKVAFYDHDKKKWIKTSKMIFRI